MAFNHQEPDIPTTEEEVDEVLSNLTLYNLDMQNQFFLQQYSNPNSNNHVQDGGSPVYSPPYIPYTSPSAFPDTPDTFATNPFEFYSPPASAADYPVPGVPESGESYVEKSPNSTDTNTVTAIEYNTDPYIYEQRV